MRAPLLVLLLLGVSLGVLGQSKNIRQEYKLLWKIDGNGLKKPSYLFGTMHVEDDRAFEFPDSLYLKLAECEAFATEVHPDSMVQAALSVMFNNTEGKDFRSLLSEAEYKEIDSLLRANSEYTLERLKSPMLAQMVLRERPGKKDNPVFLDAYLYSVANGQGKKILGLEDVGNQLAQLTPTNADDVREMVQSLVGKKTSRTHSDQLLELYHTGNLDQMLMQMHLWSQSDPESFDRIFTKRNYDMLASIVREIHLQSTFIAVGAGHLPGSEGLLDLLQKRGYRVSRITPLFTGLSKKFKLEKKEREWPLVTDDAGRYSVEMPSTPITYKPDSTGNAFHAAIDIGGPSFFQTTYRSIDRELSGRPASVALKKLEERLRKRQSGIEQIKHTTLAGFPALEYAQRDGDNYFRCFFVLRDPVLYLLQVGPTRATAHSTEAARFINSWKPLEFKREQWQELLDEKGAFSVQFIGKPEPRQNKTTIDSKEVIIHVFLGEDKTAREYYLLRYNDFPPGYSPMDDSLYTASFANDLMVRMNGSNLQTSPATLGGLPATEIRYDLTSELEVVARSVFRGSRHFLLLGGRPKDAGNSGIPVMFDSFRFTDFKSSTMNRRAIDSLSSILSPTPFTYDSLESGRESSMLYATDPSSGAPLLVHAYKMDDYQYVKDPETYFKSFDDMDDTDSLLSQLPVTGNGYIGTDMIFRQSRVNSYMRKCVIVAGQFNYELTAIVPPGYERSEFINSFFNSLELNVPKTSWSLFTKKTSALLSDLHSPDTVVRDNARGSIYAYSFEPSDLPQLYDAIRISYDDDGEEYGSTRRSLLAKLSSTNDNTTASFIRDVYFSLPASTNCRETALNILSTLQTPEGIAVFFDLLSREDSVKLGAYTILEGFRDSLALAEPVLERIFAHRHRMEYLSPLYNLTTAVLTHEGISDAGKNAVAELLVRTMQDDLKQPVLLGKDDEEYYAYNYMYESMVEALSTEPALPEETRLIGTLAQIGYPSPTLAAVPWLIKNKQTLPKEHIETLAASPLHRIDLFTALLEAGEIKLFPERWKTQAAMAESMLTRYMDGDEGTPFALESLGTRAVLYNDQKQVMYLYRYKQYEEDEDWYLAMSGPFVDKELTSDEQLTFNTYTTYTPATLKEDLATILEDTGATLLKR